MIHKLKVMMMMVMLMMKRTVIVVTEDLVKVKLLELHQLMYPHSSYVWLQPQQSWICCTNCMDQCVNGESVTES